MRNTIWKLVLVILLWAPVNLVAQIPFAIHVSDQTIDDFEIISTGKSEYYAWSFVTAPTTSLQPTIVDLTNEHLTFYAGESVNLNPGFEAQVSGTGGFIASITSTLAIAPNEFKLGIYGFGALKYKTTTPFQCVETTPLHAPLTSTTTIGGEPTSILNVLSEDGFNIVEVGFPGSYDGTRNYAEDGLRLIKNNGMQAMFAHTSYFQPDLTGYGGKSTFDDNESTISSNDPYKLCRARPHYDDLLNNVYSSKEFKSTVWGYKLTEEAAYGQPHNPLDDVIVWNDCEKARFIDVPTALVSEAVSHFKSILAAKGVVNQKMVVMESHHGKAIHNASLGPEPADPVHPYCPCATTPSAYCLDNVSSGSTQPQDYIDPMSMTSMPDVFFEGSYYYGFPSDWSSKFYDQMKFGNNFHYLGMFESIDFAFTKVNEVHDVLNIQGHVQIDQDLNIPNANLLWFQAYTSIIHGVQGIWFWDFTASYDQNSPADQARKTNLHNGDYDRSNFPSLYNGYVKNLARELRFLMDKNLLSTDPVTVLETKTTGTDQNFIVPPIQVYVNSTTPAVPLADLFEHSNENYGLRYVIRTNGQEVIMIVTNPLPVALPTVTFKFLKDVFSNTVIDNSIGVDVLFEAGGVSTSSNSYKNNRHTNIDLVNGTVGVQHFLPFTNIAPGINHLDLEFGPLDVKVLRFRFAVDGLIGERKASEDEPLNAPTSNHIVDDEQLSANLETNEEPPSEQNNFNVQIYPNPNSGKFNITFQGRYKSVMSIKITDIRGRLVYEEREVSGDIVDLNLETEPKGVYLVNVFWDAGVTIKRLIVY